MGLFDFLEKQLERVNYWLNFSEAKLAAVIALNIAVFASVNSIDEMTAWVKGMTDIILIASLAMAVIGLLPRISTRPVCENANTSKNLVFYQYIATLNADTYINEIEQTYGISSNTGSKLQGKAYTQQEFDLAGEVIENSRIIVRKNRIFKWAILFDIASFILIGIGVVLIFVAARNGEYSGAPEAPVR